MASRYFPPAQYAEPDGLLALSVDLSTPRLVDAYRHGIFPWPFAENDLIPWVSPDPRAVLPLDALHVSRRLARRIRSGQFRATCNTAFDDVIEGCATAGDRRGNTWLFPEMIRAYRRLHREGHAHSVDVWEGDRLVGGIYGVAVGGAFSAESMFYRVRDASKVALYHLVQHLQDKRFSLLDVQQWTPHTARMGAVEISRRDFLDRLARVVDAQATFGDAPTQSTDAVPDS